MNQCTMNHFKCLMEVNIFHSFFSLNAFGAALHPHGGVCAPAELALVLEKAVWGRRTGSGAGRWPGALAGPGTGEWRASEAPVEKGWRPSGKHKSPYRLEAGARSLGPGARQAPLYIFHSYLTYNAHSGPVIVYQSLSEPHRTLLVLLQCRMPWLFT